MDRFKVMAVDPGGTTGVAVGRFDNKLGTVADTCRERLKLETFELTGGWLDQAEEIAEMWCRNMYNWQYGKETIFLVVEDFVLTRLGSSDRLGLYPVRIASALEAFLWHSEGYKEIDYQMPGKAKGFVTNERLKRWGLWQVGSEHKRDACRHLATKMNDVL